MTLHTVLSEPTVHQLRVLTELCEQAESVIVMTETARRLLDQVGACPDHKIRVVPHGAPVELGSRRAEQAGRPPPPVITRMPGGYERMQSRFLLSTSG